MAISDTLSDASCEINEYLDTRADAYDFATRREIEHVLSKMDGLRQRLDNPTYDFSAVNTITSAFAQLRADADWLQSYATQLAQQSAIATAAKAIGGNGARDLLQAAGV